MQYSENSVCFASAPLLAANRSPSFARYQRARRATSIGGCGSVVGSPLAHPATLAACSEVSPVQWHVRRHVPVPAVGGGGAAGVGAVAVAERVAGRRAARVRLV